MTLETKLEPLPENPEAELALLSCLVIDPALLDVIRLDADAFYGRARRDIYTTLCGLYDEQGAADLVLLRDRLREQGFWSRPSVQDTFLDLVDERSATWRLGNAEHYAALVRREAARRALVKLSRVASKSGATTEDPERLAETIRNQLDQSAVVGAAPLTAEEVLPSLEDRLTDERKGGHLKFGLPGLDDIARLRPGELVVITGRPSAGKTALVCQLIRSLSIERDVATLFFSAEMSAEAVFLILMRGLAGVDYARVMGGFSPREYEAWQQARQRLTGAPVYVDERSSIAVEDLYSSARRWCRARDCRVVFADHLQRLRTAQHGRRHEQLAHIVRRCKDLAKDADATFVLTSQLGRPDERGHQKPKGSGAIEEDADVMLRLRYRALFDDPEQKEPDLAERKLVVTKQRTGPTGSVVLAFDKPVAQFREMTPEEAAKLTAERQQEPEADVDVDGLAQTFPWGD